MYHFEFAGKAGSREGNGKIVGLTVILLSYRLTGIKIQTETPLTKTPSRTGFFNSLHLPPYFLPSGHEPIEKNWST
jgi:hypothetical protein